MKQSVYVNLIVLVQNHPCLYDTSNSLYKNTKYKNDRWSEIANSLGEQGKLQKARHITIFIHLHYCKHIDKELLVILEIR